MIKTTLLSILVLAYTSLIAQNIDLTNWKVTLPITKANGKLVELEHPEIHNFESNDLVKPFFYRDPSDSSIVFKAYPAQTTRNTKYSRTELREQMEPGSNKVNWTFEQGGRMRGTLSVPEVTQKANGDYHRVIIMQIHGRLTNEQRDLIGEDDNNAPPILKIYWDEGKVRVKTKVLKDPKASEEEVLHEKAWGDDKGRNFKEIVGTDKFTLEVNVSKGLMTVTLNDRETFVYEGIDIDRWGVFENYFKAGNYFQSRDEGSYAIVKYYQLELSHEKNSKYVKPKTTSKEVTSEKKPSLNKSGFDPTNWSLELPSGYKASAWKLSNYENDQFVKPFFYKDSVDGALVMEAYEVENSTSKAKYIRNNLREQMQPGSNNVNWTMKKGGTLEAEVQVVKMSTNEKGKFHRTLLVQVDGRTSEKQTKQLGLEKAVSMPFIKVYWEDGRIRINRRILKDDTVVGDELLSKKAWKEDEGTYSKKVDFEIIKLKLIVKKGRIEINVNDEKPIVYKDFSVSQWYFENYFSAGNYLQTKDEGAHSVVKYYKLNVSHDSKK